MKQTPKKWLLLGFCILCGSSLFLGATSTNLIAADGTRSQLAQIIQVQIDILRKWQQQGSLKSNLAYASSGRDVVLLQKMLAQDATIYPSKIVSGRYGDLTARAVRNLQKDYGLPETGTVDTATRAKLNEIFFSHLCPQPSAIYPELLLRKVSNVSTLPTAYVPPGLEDISKKVRTAGIMCLREDVVPYLEQMFAAARDQGVDLMVSSAYRKPEIQRYLYDLQAASDPVGVVRQIAMPGSSEHQLGSTVDLTDASVAFETASPMFGESLGGIWLYLHAHKYGFTMSYPKHLSNLTGIIYEPWHWRFVGVETATMLKERGIAFSEATLELNDLRTVSIQRVNASF